MDCEHLNLYFDPFGALACHDCGNSGVELPVTPAHVFAAPDGPPAWSDERIAAMVRSSQAARVA